MLRDDVGQILAYEVAVDIRPARVVRSTPRGGVAASLLVPHDAEEFQDPYISPWGAAAVAGGRCL